MMHVPNAMIMEIVRGYVDGSYNDIVSDRIRIEDGLLTLDDKPGLGTALHEGFASRPRSQVQITTNEQL
jgi:galactonate dehydratase